MLTSGTNALIAGLKACDIKAGDEVIIPTYTYMATAGAIATLGATPVLADIDDSLTLSPEALEKKITNKTKAIIPVHMDGLPCDMHKISDIANQYNLKIVEDAAQAFGGTFKGQHLGTFGEVG